MRFIGKSRPRGGFARRLIPSLLASAVLAGAAVLSACTQMKPVPPLPRKVAVLDFKVASQIAGAPTEVTGWWFGARTVNRNPNAGPMFADALGRRLPDLGYLEQVSRSQVKFYMLGKRKRLRSSFMDLGLKEEDYTRMLQEVSPVDYGEELGVDQVLTGRVMEAYTLTHNTLRCWHSFIRVEVDVWDVASGQVVWTEVFFKKKRFFSQSETMEQLAPGVVEALDATYYQLLDKPRGVR